METLDDLRDCFCALLDGELSPVATGETVCAAALGRGNGQWPWLWLLWAQLTARWAEDENARRQAEDEMRLAAKEWLFVADGEANWHAYFDRWLNTGLGSVGDRAPDHEGLVRGLSKC